MFAGAVLTLLGLMVLMSAVITAVIVAGLAGAAMKRIAGALARALRRGSRRRAAGRPDETPALRGIRSPGRGARASR